MASASFSLDPAMGSVCSGAVSGSDAVVRSSGDGRSLKNNSAEKCEARFS